jgi:hypothetical protein
MADSNEIDALKAAFRGALSTTAALEALTDRIASLESRSRHRGRRFGRISRA